MMNKVRHIMFAVAVVAMMPAMAVGQVTLDVTVEDGMSRKALNGTTLMFFCDGNEEVVSVETDRYGRALAKGLPSGRCLVATSQYRPILLNLERDSTIHSLALMPDPMFHSPVPRGCYVSRETKHQALRTESAALQRDIDWQGEEWWSAPNYQRLAWLYYIDHIYPLQQWRTFPADSALYWLKYCYNKAPHRFGYMYYAICQVEHSLGVEHDEQIVSPQSSTYCRLPQMVEGWEEDQDQDYISLMEGPFTRSAALARLLRPMGEESLAQKGGDVARLITTRADGEAEVYRIERGKITYKWVKTERDSIVGAQRIELTAKGAEKEMLGRLTNRIFERLTLSNNTATDDSITLQVERRTSRGHRISEYVTPGQDMQIDSLASLLNDLRERATYNLTLKVVDPTGQRELKNATVKIAGDNLIASIEAGDTAEVTIKGLSKGKYHITIERRYYEPLSLEVKVKGHTQLPPQKMRRRRGQQSVTRNSEN